MKNLGYYNGTIDLIEAVTVPMNDRATCFGDGCYDAMYCRNYIIYCLDEHLDRLYNSAALLGIRPPYTKAETADLLRELGTYLPRYMLPAILEKLEELPFTVNGKIDRKGLRERAESV